MKVPVQWQDVPPDRPKWWQSLQRIFQLITKAINGNISLGVTQNVNGSLLTPLQTVSPMTATSQFSVNIDIVWVFLQTPAVANTDFTVNHNLGRVCNGIIIAGQDAAAVTYTSPTYIGGGPPFSTTAIILRCNTANVKITMGLF